MFEACLLLDRGVVEKDKILTAILKYCSLLDSVLIFLKKRKKDVQRGVGSSSFSLQV